MASQNLPSGLVDTVKVGCAVGSGFLSGKAVSSVKTGKFRFADLLVATATALGGYAGLKCGNALADVVTQIQPGN
ncbi:hypothetical protein GCM10023084_79850 [Streptomyces lacrimifluminis]|uniref:Uncharacterized protein n=1 Tax=Streptomyces lacrimifluminis TaxID=1500077 RepID=A0A917UMU7_9ACTN|nr:hypothetical protein [Streptomyces lacrimifluminis]GGJ69121.1 hypothetical protein GCM10012282_77620 [Streptomyces lacrimifluminis]